MPGDTHHVLHRGGRLAIVVAVWAVGMATSLREVVFSGLSVTQGSTWDHRLLVYLSEHWYRVASGSAAWRNPSYFHPVADDLGYTDALVLFQPVYVPLRWLGVDQFAAFQLALMAMATAGFIGALWLFRRVVGAGFAVSLIGAFVFAFANNLAVQFHHGQLMAVQLLPGLVVLAAGALRAAGSGRTGRAAALGAAAGALGAALLFTAFYIGWFAVVAGAVAAVGVAVCAWPVVVGGWRWVMAHRRGVAAATGSAAVAAAVAAVPFAITYLPMLESSGGWTYDQVMAFMPTWANVANLGTNNLVWSGVIERLGPTVTEAVPAPSITPLLAVTTVTGVAVALVWRRGTADMGRLRVAAGLTVASVALALCSLKFGEWSAWRVVYEVVPGADAIRVAGRLPMVVSLLVVTAWVVMADVVWRQVRNWWSGGVARRVAVVAVVALALAVPAEQIQTGLWYSLDRDAELAALSTVGTPPPGCGWFVVVNPAPGRRDYESQLDAMLVSHAVGLPTPNGYSGLFPDDWALVDPALDGYGAAVDAWVQANGLGGDGCRFDLRARTWSAW